MWLRYGPRALLAVSLLGVVSAVASVLSLLLLLRLQLQAQQQQRAPPGTAALLPDHICAVLLPLAAVLSALSLGLHLSCAVVCLLHAYLSAEVCRGEQDADRADWFLLDTRAVRHVAVGLFCLGVSVYLAALALFMLLIFEVETGIAGACVLSSGIPILLLAVVHSLVKASLSAKRRRGDRLDTLYENDHGSSPLSRRGELKIGADKPRLHRGQSHLQHSVAYPHCGNPRQRELQQQYSPEGSHAGDREGYGSGGGGGGGGGSYPRMHRTLSTESGLLQAQAKPWNGVNNEMRSVLARKSGVSAKDSTLV